MKMKAGPEHIKYVYPILKEMEASAKVRRPVTYEQVTRDERFWDQCKHCVNHAVLESQGRKRCLCTAMLFKPKEELYA
jgi:hypothetical protein